MVVVHGIYGQLFGVGLRFPTMVAVGLFVTAVALCIALLPFLGREFMPKLEEGNFWIPATLPRSVSLETSSLYVGQMREIIRSHTEVTTGVSQLGRPDDGTAVSGFFNIKLFPPLKQL